MQHHLGHTHSAPSSTTSLAGNRPPVPRFSEPSMGSISHNQAFDMTALDSMQGSSPRGNPDVPTSLTSHAADMDSPLNDFSLGSMSGLEMAGSPFNVHRPDSHLPPTADHPSMDRTLSMSTDLTMSPYDMHNSTPASGAMTHQSTPQTDYIDTPYTPSVYFSNGPSPAWAIHDSPAINDNLDFDPNMSGMMFPDLPEPNDKQLTAPKPASTKPVVMSRKDASPGKSPRTSRSSLTSGITKPTKKRKGPLKDIVVDPDDPKSLKRSRNTLAARNSRARRQERFEALAEECEIWRQRALDLGWQDKHEDAEE
ncbi:MAG: hypothetical protein Q9201_006440 [Fulgogasparrea decipioides]